MRSKAEIEAEIAALFEVAKNFDTIGQTPIDCAAAGAHDALRWALGLAERSMSETLKSVG